MRPSWEEQNAEKCTGCAQEQQLVPCTKMRRDNLGQPGQSSQVLAGEENILSGSSMNAFVPGSSQKKNPKKGQFRDVCIAALCSLFTCVVLGSCSLDFHNFPFWS